MTTINTYTTAQQVVILTYTRHPHNSNKEIIISIDFHPPLKDVTKPGATTYKRMGYKYFRCIIPMLTTQIPKKKIYIYILDASKEGSFYIKFRGVG
jgi:hypothetical protein